jgi:hypothetical protein
MVYVHDFKILWLYKGSSGAVSFDFIGDVCVDLKSFFFFNEGETKMKKRSGYKIETLITKALKNMRNAKGLSLIKHGRFLRGRTSIYDLRLECRDID